MNEVLLVLSCPLRFLLNFKENRDWLAEDKSVMVR